MAEPLRLNIAITLIGEIMPADVTALLATIAQVQAAFTADETSAAAAATAAGTSI